MRKKFLITNFKFLIGQGGQALVTLLFFIVISLTITSAAVVMIILSSRSTSSVSIGMSAYYAAESGIENGLLRLIRDPSYTGETLDIDGSTAVITVSGTEPKTITSVGQNGNFKRTIEAQLNYNSGYYTISNWKEI